VRVLFGSLVTLILLATLISPGAGDSSLLGYSIEIGEQGVTASINIRIRQNLTSVEASFTLPQLHSVLEGANSSSLATEVQNALRLKNPGAQVTSLRLEAFSTAWSSQSRFQWFNISLSFEVENVWTSKGGVTDYDLSWRAFTVPASVAMGGFEVNNIGSAHLLNVASELASQDSGGSSLVRVTFRVSGRAVSAARFPEVVSKISTLNFSSLAPALSLWQEKRDATVESASWSLGAGQPLGMSYITSIQEPEVGLVSITYGVLYQLEASVTAPRRSSISGDSIIVIWDEFPEAMMGIAILSVAFLGSGTFLYERRLLRNTGRKKTKG
jgi:hypothetical protein